MEEEEDLAETVLVYLCSESIPIAWAKPGNSTIIVAIP